MDGDCSHEIKRFAPWKKSYDKHRQYIKQRPHLTDKGPCSQSCVVKPVVMYECESWTIEKAVAKELMLLNCSVGGDSSESPGQQGDPTSQS